MVYQIFAQLDPDECVLQVISVLLICKIESYLRIVGFLEIGQQQADEHRALLLVAHKSAHPTVTYLKKKKVTRRKVNKKTEEK